jgi:hypothetical protein
MRAIDQQLEVLQVAGLSGEEAGECVDSGVTPGVQDENRWSAPRVTDVGAIRGHSQEQIGVSRHALRNSKACSP